MVKISQNGSNTKQLAVSWMLFHSHNTSYLLPQLCVAHLGVVLLSKIEVSSGSKIFLIKCFLVIKTDYNKRGNKNQKIAAIASLHNVSFTIKKSTQMKISLD